jgi:MFS family permease
MPGNDSALRYAKQALTVFKRYPAVLLYCLTGALLGACLVYYDEFWQIVFNEISIPLYFFGAFSALTQAICIPGSLLAYKMKNLLGYKRVFAFIIAVNAVGYLVISFSPNLLSLIAMLLLSLTSGIAEPLVSGYMHHHTESRIRATVESFSSLMLRVLSMGVGLVFGYVSTGFSIFAGFLVPGIICALFLVYFTLKVK